MCQSSPKNKEAKQFASFFWKNHRTLVKNLFWTPRDLTPKVSTALFFT
ncbi:hypothetical protein HPSD74_0992 [Glaesserella parasuis D74]|nr:hypothetical protein HPSD74_1093 [Glaesserella parasuis D74]EQA10022.1 hypothetical protein HPSD74_0992 [Glaesserella parasuis D74]